MLLAGSATLVGSGCKTDRKPNILLISLDACRADHLGSYGYHRNTSPFLDSLATKGTLYRNAFANTLGTLPSHATILSSQYQEMHRLDYYGGADGGSLHAISLDMPFLPEILRKNGYVTVGVTAGGFVGPKFGFNRGFDEFIAEHQNVGLGTRRLVDLIRRHTAKGQPLFALFHTYQIHSPYFPPRRFRSLFGEFDSQFVPTSENLIRILPSAEEELSLADRNRIVAWYDGEIRFTDEKLRQLFDALEELDFLQNALVIVTSDHGEEFLEHGHVLHEGFLYDELLQVPLLVSGRGIPKGRVVDRLVSTVDLAPSILSHVGLPPHPAMRGSDIFGPLPEQSPTDEVLFAQFRDRRFALRTRDWKLIDDRSAGRVELYHLVDDAAEQRNLAVQYPEMVEDFKKDIARWRSANKPARQQQPPVDLDDEEIERLKALGYLGER